MVCTVLLVGGLVAFSYRDKLRKLRPAKKVHPRFKICERGNGKVYAMYRTDKDSSWQNIDERGFTSCYSSYDFNSMEEAEAAIQKKKDHLHEAELTNVVRSSYIP